MGVAGNVGNRGFRVLLSDDEAGDELGKCEKNEAIYHTYHEHIAYTIKRIFGFRKATSR